MRPYAPNRTPRNIRMNNLRYVLAPTRVRLDPGTDADGGRRANGLRRTPLESSPGLGSMWGDVTLHPFVPGHRLVRDDIMDVGVLRALDEHPYVLAQGQQGRQLVMHLNAERARRTLRRTYAAD